MDSRLEIRSALAKARLRTQELLAPIPEEDLVRSISPGHSPLVWDLVDIARFEELWLLRNLNGQASVAKLRDDVSRAFAGVRRGSQLETLHPAAARAYADDVRERAFDVLEHADLDGSALLRKGFVFGLVLQHELRRQETMLETVQLRSDVEYPLPSGVPPDRAPAGSGEVHVPGGAFVLGAVDEPRALDNELVPHEVELRPYWIDRTPVTNAAFAEFIADDGYGTETLWSGEGWSWVQSEGVVAPLYWDGGSDGWERLRFGRREPLPLGEPVQHVSWYEAEAFAQWAGKRLPSEVEWERAAGWDEHAGKTRYPWGREWMGCEANLGRLRFAPAPAGSYAGGESATGCLQLAGDVWEWTSSFFHPYPGFVAFPESAYSEAFFGEEHRVLRGGSWATDAVVARSTFRRWEHPIRRELFAGFRCAWDE